MFKKIFSIFRRPKFWKNATFDEVRVLYLAKMLRILAMNLSNGFVLMYIFKLGYGWNGVLAYLMAFYVLSIFWVFFGGYYNAKFGPKHGMLLSNLLYIPMLISTVMAEKIGLPAIIASLALQGASVSIYGLSYYIDFSKVKDVKKSGRQISLMYVVEKTASALAPFIGGFLAMTFGVQSTMLISAAIFALSAIPLLATKEVMKPNIRLDFRGFPFKKHSRNFIAQSGNAAQLLIFRLLGVFVPVYVLTNFNSYGVIGFLMSASSIFAMVAAIIFGKAIDKKDGMKLLRATVFGRFVLNILRAIFIHNPIFMIFGDLINEIMAVGYMMSHQKGAFSDADRAEKRIEYFVIFEIAYMVMAIALLVVATVIFLILGAENGMRIFLVVCAFVSLLCGIGKYPAYNSKK